MADLISLKTSKESVGSVLDKLCKLHNKPLFSGGSSRGWSRYSRLQRCPKLYKLTYISPPKRQDFEVEHSESFEIGTAFHAFLSMHYSKNWWTPQELLDMLLASSCESSFISEAWRLYDAYSCQYEMDFIDPLGVEVTAKDPNTNNSCRYDLIAKVRTDYPTKELQRLGLIPGGTYIIEHKTTKAMYGDSIDGWDMEGEIRGEVALWERDPEIVNKYGQLSGLIINIISRAKKPAMKRVLIAPSSISTKQHLRALDEWTEIESFYRNQDNWPMASTGCVTKYSRCEFYNYCRTGGE